MAAQRTMYQIVGRYMNGSEVVGYHLLCNESGKAGRYTKEQICYLVGRGQITNCSGQIYKDKVLLRGIGISLDSLPVKQENGELSRTDNIGKIRKGTSAADAMTQYIIVAAITSGHANVGYVVQNAGGAKHNINRETAFKLAKLGRIGNARYQESNGKPIIRGVGINLNNIESIPIESIRREDSQ